MLCLPHNLPSKFNINVKPATLNCITTTTTATIQQQYISYWITTMDETAIRWHSITNELIRLIYCYWKYFDFYSFTPDLHSLSPVDVSGVRSNVWLGAKTHIYSTNPSWNEPRENETEKMEENGRERAYSMCNMCSAMRNAWEFKWLNGVRAVVAFSAGAPNTFFTHSMCVCVCLCAFSQKYRQRCVICYSSTHQQMNYYKQWIWSNVLICVCVCFSLSFLLSFLALNIVSAVFAITSVSLFLVVYFHLSFVCIFMLPDGTFTGAAGLRENCEWQILL